MTDVLYHATWPSHADAIERDGLMPGTFFANTPGYAAAFLAMRPGEFIGMMTLDTPDGPIEVPNIVRHDEVVVFAVHVDTLDADRLDESHDHVAAFYPADLQCWEYHDTISADALVRLDPINISKVA